MITRSTAAAVLLFCSLANADPKPTATEVFHLRSECQKIVENLAQTPFAGSHWSTRATNTEDGHCYMMVESTESSEGRKGGMSCTSISLHDAQTDDMKAHAKTGTACPESGTNKYSASRVGMVFTARKELCGQMADKFSCAMAYINHKMQSD